MRFPTSDSIVGLTDPDKPNGYRPSSEIKAELACRLDEADAISAKPNLDSVDQQRWDVLMGDRGSVAKLQCELDKALEYENDKKARALAQHYA